MLSLSPTQQLSGFQALQQHQRSRRLSRTRAPVVQVASGLRSDPWKTLGLERGASEDEIKRKHRKLVKENHPDIKKGDTMAHARFISIQQAYEILTGKSRGQDIDTDESGKQGWDFHDWYWKFTMRRRRHAASNTPPPPPPEVVRDQWKSQVSNLRQRAVQKAARRSTRFANGQKREDFGSYDYENVAVTSDDDVHQQQQAETEPVMASSSPSDDDVDTSSTVDAEQHHQSTENDEEEESEKQQLKEILSEAMHAVRDMHQRHNHAVNSHMKTAVGHIVEFTARIQSKLHHAVPAGASATTLKEQQHAATATMMHETVSTAAHTTSHHHHHQQEEQQQHIPLYDNHARKFADTEHVQSRLSHQLVGLKRRSALKQED